SKSLANASLDAVTVGGCRGVLARDQNPQPGLAVVTAREEKRIPAQRATLALAEQALELAFAPQPACRIQTEALFYCRDNGYSPRRRRPRARRLRSTARPPRVRLRTRKPWRRARRVLDGWYVRLVAICQSEKGRY